MICNSPGPVRLQRAVITATAAEIEQEPMLFDSDLVFAGQQGGPITRQFIGALSPAYDWVIDSRVHMLMPGWFPAIPGWHHDDVARTRSDGQPDYTWLNGEWVPRGYRSKHVMLVVDASDAPTGSMTEFAVGSWAMPNPYQPGRPVYSIWSDHLDEVVTGEQRMCVESGKTYYFGWDAFHRVMPATSPGWRFFIRATTDTDDKPVNKIRRQANVYLSALTEGW